MLPTNRALVAVASATNAINAAAAPASRPDAGFLAHLIAMSAQAPQTRLRRRAEPSTASAAYGALSHWPTPLGRAVSRSL